MASDSELYEMVLKWAATLPRQLKCPACNDHEWELRSMEETFGKPEGAAVKIPPIVTIMCRCCGHLSFFDSKAMGLS
ncbi:hypothetical protein AYO40_03640 [Planctomycetaceae bacterium SCGC AG-212-D15]|nr:hypothetical protein AYO40_03640 [Planctomycetaceae bacterium SCGC AG-212-D15]